MEYVKLKGTFLIEKEYIKNNNFDGFLIDMQNTSQYEDISDVIMYFEDFGNDNNGVYEFEIYCYAKLNDDYTTYGMDYFLDNIKSYIADKIESFSNRYPQYFELNLNL